MKSLWLFSYDYVPPAPHHLHLFLNGVLPLLEVPQLRLFVTIQDAMKELQSTIVHHYLLAVLIPDR